MTGLSKPVVRSRDALLRSQLEAHVPNNETYTLVAKSVNVGVALLVYARDDTVAPRVRDVQTQWASCGPGWMGNKGAVAIRFRVGDEVYTFLNAHLTAHLPNYERRAQDWADIISSMLFPPLPGSKSKTHSTIYDSTHLFFFGDLNFRLDVPKSLDRPDFERMARTVEGRKQLLQYDQLVRAQRENRIPSMSEAPLWDFQPSYKFLLKHVDKYRSVHVYRLPMSAPELTASGLNSEHRLPAWTDRILYASASDKSTTQSSIESLLYTSIPSYTTSDHKPVMALLLLPSPPPVLLPPEAGPADSTTSLLPPTRTLTIPHPGTRYAPDPRWQLKRWTGKVLGWLIGWPWCLTTLLGAGSVIAGVINLVLGCAVIYWWAGGWP